MVETVVGQVVLVLCIWNVYIAVMRFNAESEDRAVAAAVAKLQVKKIMNTCFRWNADLR